MYRAAHDKEPSGPNGQTCPGKSQPRSFRKQDALRSLFLSFFFFQDFSVLFLKGGGGRKAKVIFKKGRNGFTPMLGIFPFETAVSPYYVLNRAIEFQQTGMGKPNVDSLPPSMGEK